MNLTLAQYKSDYIYIFPKRRTQNAANISLHTKLRNVFTFRYFKENN